MLRGWSPKAPVPQARFALGAAEAGGRLYAMGGAGSSVLFTRNDIYDPSTNTWLTGAPMPAAREGRGLATLRGKVYAVGGNAGGSVHASVAVYDPAAETWAAAADLLHPRAHFTLVAADDSLFAIGGETGPGFPGPASNATTRTRTPGRTWRLCLRRGRSRPVVRSWSEAPRRYSSRAAADQVAFRRQYPICMTWEAMCGAKALG